MFQKYGYYDGTTVSGSTTRNYLKPTRYHDSTCVLIYLKAKSTVGATRCTKFSKTCCTYVPSTSYFRYRNIHKYDNFETLKIIAGLSAIYSTQLLLVLVEL